MTKIKSPSSMWQQPWRYRESIVIVLGILIIGFLLQITVGHFNYYFLVRPTNLILLFIILIGLLIACRKRSNSFLLWLSGVPISIILCSALLVMGIIMGVIHQDSPGITHRNSHSIIDILGFKNVTSMWPFVLTYLILLISLGALIIRRLLDFHLTDYAFYLNHIGLWILLLAAGLGSADIKRYVMQVNLGEVEWRATDLEKHVTELPLAIELNQFDMQQYPPKLAIINRNSGKVQPEANPKYFDLNNSNKSCTIGLWNIKLKHYFPEASHNTDSTFIQMPIRESVPAAEVAVLNTKTGKTQIGWISVGNTEQSYSVLNLSPDYCIVMTQPEPKHFLSDIDIFTKSGKAYHHIQLAVNKPFHTGNWMVYQYGYDQSAGKMSAFSSFELVYDPWIYGVYIGMILFGFGAICLIIKGKRK